MKVHFECPGCGASGNKEVQTDWKQVKCRKCSTSFKVFKSSEIGPEKVSKDFVESSNLFDTAVDLEEEKTNRINLMDRKVVNTSPNQTVTQGLEKCKTCGQHVARSAISCPHCGQSFPTSKVECPKCSNTNVLMGNKGFSTGAAAAGGLVLGPLGILLGNVKSKRQEYFCTKCEHRWLTESSQKMHDDEERQSKGCAFGCLIFFILFCFLAWLEQN